MAMNFPDAPVLGQLFTSPDGDVYVWDGVKWTIPAGSGVDQIDGPLGIGMSPPSNAMQGELLVDGLLSLVPFVRPGLAAHVARFAGNAYIDTVGNWRYLADGPAYILRMDNTVARWEFSVIKPGLAGAVFDPGDMNINSPSVLMTALAMGVGVAPPVDTGANTLFTDRLTLRWSPGVAGALGARVYMNAYLDNTGSVVRYIADGPAYAMVATAASPGLSFGSAAAGSAGGVVTFGGGDMAALVPGSGTTSGQTNFTLITNSGGTVTLQRVLVGPAGSGPGGGSNKVLYVAT